MSIGNLSCLMSDVLDCIGYSEEIINVRRNYWHDTAHIQKQVKSGKPLFDVNRGEEMPVTIAGSKGEGITSYYESDIDIMFHINDAICTDDIQHLPPVPDMTVLHADTSEAPPGYTRLRLISCNGITSRRILMKSAFVSESKDVYISSAQFASVYMRELKCWDSYTKDDLSGPSIPRNFSHLSVDNVFAFPCYHSKLLRAWKSRKRLHNWPPADVLEAAASEISQVVAVGQKGSLNQWREWRFCFIKSELKLTFSLNETQVKLYTLLKMVAKDILSNVSKEISSFIMKNISFWLSELLQEDMFRKHNLLSLLVLALRFLKLAISNWNWLPYFMIPTRNLLAEKLSHDARCQLSDLIGTLIAEGPRFLLRCIKLRKALTVCLSSPALLVDYGRRRNMTEILYYIKNILEESNADQSWYLVINAMKGLVVPEWNIPVGKLPIEKLLFFWNRTISILS